MNQKNIEDALREKFGDFSQNYKASDSMWENIEGQLPQKNSRNKLIVIVLLVVVVGFAIIHMVNSPVAVTSDTIATEDLKVVPDKEETQAVMEINKDENQKSSDAYISIDGQDHKEFVISANTLEYQSKSPTVSTETVKALHSGLIVNINNDSKVVSASELNAVSALIGEHESELSFQEMDQIVLLPSLSSKIDFSSRSYNHDSPDMQRSLARIDHKDKRWSLGIAAGYTSVTPKYGLNNSSYQSLLAERQSSESAKAQYNCGLEVEYDITESFSILMGLNLSFFQDELFNESGLTLTDTIQNYEMPTQTSSGVDTTLIGTAIKTTTRNTKTWNYTNRYLLSIPVLVSYNTALGSKSQLGFGVGIEKYIFTKINGMALDLNGEFYDLSTDLENRYGTRGVNALLRFNYNYQLTNNWDLRLMINYKNALLSNYNSSAPIQKSFNGIGVGIGSHIKF